MAAGAQRAAAFTRENDRKIFVVVPDPVTIDIAEEDHRVVEQSGVAFRH